MASTSEYEQQQFWQKPKFTTVVLPDGQRISFMKEFWDELLYGDVNKLVVKPFKEYLP